LPVVGELEQMRMKVQTLWRKSRTGYCEQLLSARCPRVPGPQLSLPAASDLSHSSLFCFFFFLLRQSLVM
jgi:hypothetical protein